MFFLRFVYSSIVTRCKLLNELIKSVSTLEFFFPWVNIFFSSQSSIGTEWHFTGGYEELWQISSSRTLQWSKQSQRLWYEFRRHRLPSWCDQFLLNSGFCFRSGNSAIPGDCSGNRFNQWGFDGILMQYACKWTNVKWFFLHFWQTYTADIFFSQKWKDNRLRFPSNMTHGYRMLNVEWLKEIWRPDSFFKNAKSVQFQTVTVPNHYVWLYRDKTISYVMKLTLQLTCAMDFAIYPHDTQECKMQIESSKLPANEWKHTHTADFMILFTLCSIAHHWWIAVRMGYP